MRKIAVLSKKKIAVSKPRRAKSVKKRQSLSATDWVNEAIEVLVTRSIEHVRVEPLAKRLGATKGSFYWHFKDRAALLDAVIEEWTRQATVQAVEWTKAGSTTARQQLRRLLDFRSFTTARWADLELAMRAWSRRSRPARLAALKVDRSRLEYLIGLFEELGLDDQEAYARALIFYGTTQTVGRFTEIENFQTQFLDRILEIVLTENPKR
jgi:AcrR family transcriptional regulator